MSLIPGSRKSLEEGIATHSSILAWRIPWTQESGGLQSMGSRVEHDSMHAPSLPGLETAYWISVVILGALDLQGC